MTKFRVPIKMEFDGAVEVEARDEVQAEELVCSNLRARMYSVSDNGCENIIDWEFDVHGFAELRDNESIEEIEEDSFLYSDDKLNRLTDLQN